jgi:cation:H+ antiporter
VLLVLALGFGLLVGGADLLVRGASALGVQQGLSPTFVGLTIVAAGTSAPELSVSLVSALEGHPDLAVGNIVGSNIFNVLLVLGLAAVVQPLDVRGATVRLEWPAMMLSSLAFLVVARDGRLDSLDGLLLFSAYVAFISMNAYVAPHLVAPDEAAAFSENLVDELQATEPSVGRAWALTLLGAALLAAGGHWVSDGAARLTDVLGVSQRVVGLTVAAIGTSLPELFTCVVASMRGEHDIAVSHVVGSNIVNVLGILGLISLVHPLPVGEQMLRVDAMWMIGSAALLFPLVLSRTKIHRVEGQLLMVAAAIYGATLFAQG